jgi:3',5'-cyclic-AMP phosphodiesterase
MSRPFTIVQLTDPHIGAPWSADPAAALARAIAAILETLGGPPDALLVSGDIASTPLDAEYAEARRLLEQLGAPVYVLPGNHDDRSGLARGFGLNAVSGLDRATGLDAAPGDPLSYTAAVGPVRLVALDTTRPGAAGGQLDSARIEWLAGALEADREAPTLLAMHHPPLVTGLRAMDQIGIPEPDRAALASVLAGHEQVQLIVAGHVHRTIVGALAGVPVLAIPSSDVQLALDFDSDELRFVPEPPCFAVHVLVAGRLVAHVQPIPAA